MVSAPSMIVQFPGEDTALRAELAANTGAGMIGTTSGDTVQEALNALAEAETASSTIFVSARGLGAKLDSNLVTGGGTDDTAILQAALDATRPTGASLCLVLDGPALVTGLDIGSNTEIRCLPGAGMYLADGSDRSMIRNKNRTRSTKAHVLAGTWPDDIVDENITLAGGVYNGNWPGQQKAETGAEWVVGLRFLGVRNLTLTGLTVVDPRNFGVQIHVAENITIRDVRQELPSGQTPEGLHQDFLHFNGPCRNIYASNVSGKSWDDFIALNADDGSGNLYDTNEGGLMLGQGPITDVLIDGVTMEECLFGPRILSHTSLIDRVTIRNVKGTTRGHYLTIDMFPEGTNTTDPGNFGRLTFENWDVIQHDQPISFVEAQGGPGGDPCIKINGKVKSLNFKNMHVSNLNDNQSEHNWLKMGRYADVDQLTIDGLSIYHKGVMPDLNDGGMVVLFGKAKRVSIANVDWYRESTVEKAGALFVAADVYPGICDLGTLRITNVQANRITSIVGLGVAPDSLAMSGVEMTDWKTTDANGIGALVWVNNEVTQVFEAHFSADCKGAFLLRDATPANVLISAPPHMAQFTVAGGIVTITRKSPYIFSITRLGTGSYQIGPTGLATNCAVVAMPSDGLIASISGRTADGAVTIQCRTAGGAAADPTEMSVLMARG